MLPTHSALVLSSREEQDAPSIATKQLINIKGVQRCIRIKWFALTFALRHGATETFNMKRERDRAVA